MVHPSAQAKSYVNYLKYYHSAFTKKNRKVAGCAYIHNSNSVSDENVLNSSQAVDRKITEYRSYTARTETEFFEFLKEKIGFGKFEDIVSELIDGELLPSTKLLDVVDMAVQKEFEWRLLDEQLLVFNKVVSLVEKSRTDPSGRVVLIVTGGPGTGKSVLAIQLLAYGARQQWRIAHSTGSKAFRTVLQAKTQAFANNFYKKIFNARFKSQLPVKELFSTFWDVANIGAQKTHVFDLVIGDEAHRVWDFRRNVRTYQTESDVPLIEEMINASEVTVMFLDDNQGERWLA